MASIAQHEGPKKLLQMEVPEPWLRHIDVEAAKRGTRRRGLILLALNAYIGEPPDYAEQLDNDA